jgi:solute carrier family 35 protein C2
MVIAMRFSIIQRVGAVPMSIAGIAKEVATISASALLFGDELTPLNITGVAVTVCGEFVDPLYWVPLFRSTVPIQFSQKKNLYRNWSVHAPQVS